VLEAISAASPAGKKSHPMQNLESKSEINHAQVSEFAHKAGTTDIAATEDKCGSGATGIDPHSSQSGSAPSSGSLQPSAQDRIILSNIFKAVLAAAG
jgi:hypothetical protein